jgi:membrane peptidoglycan carboxypeptidase
MYLNHIYFGGGAYGIEAAARLYFGKASAELTLAESATLAALPKAPSHYDPGGSRSGARRGGTWCWRSWSGRGWSDADAEAARATELAVRADGARDRSGVPAGPQLRRRGPGRAGGPVRRGLYRSRLRIHTTLDPVAQRAAERSWSRQLDDLRGRVRAGRASSRARW